MPRVDDVPFSSAWFEKQFARTSKSQAGLWHFLAKSLPAVHAHDRSKLNKTLKGKRQPSPSEMAAVWSYFGLPLEDLYTALGAPTPEQPTDETATIGSETGVRGLPENSVPQIDVTAGMGAGGLTIVHEGVPNRHGMTFAAEHVRDYWRLPDEVIGGLGLRSSDVVMIPVQGDSMTETLIEGDYVLVDTRHRQPSPDGIYALGDEFGGVIVKRLEVARYARDDEDAVIRVISDNPKHAPKERPLAELRIIGRVVRRFGIVS